MKDIILDEFKSLASTRAAWFLLGLACSGTSVPDIVAAVRAFAGV